MNRQIGLILSLFLLAEMLAFSGCSENGVQNETNATEEINSTVGGDENMNFQIIKVFSSAFEPNGTIPAKYTCDGENVSPPLRFEDVPEATESLALILDDPDAPRGTFTHWVVWNIEPVSNIEEDTIPGVEGVNDFQKIGYGGPCPPSGTHRYVFRVYALDKQLELKAGAGRKDLETAMIGHILAEGELIGKYR
jgi:Raf kinase inhibitor-like YbhB/YbcL family protein